MNLHLQPLVQCIHTSGCSLDNDDDDDDDDDDDGSGGRGSFCCKCNCGDTLLVLPGLFFQPDFYGRRRQRMRCTRISCSSRSRRQTGMSDEWAVVARSIMIMVLLVSWKYCREPVY